jgi:penicillin-binding protein 2
MIEKIKNRLKIVLQSRIAVLNIIICIGFYILISRLFELQIVNGEEIAQNLTATTIRTMPLQAPRGNIYDRHGRPLAVNESAFNVKMDLSTRIENQNQVVFDLVELFEEHDQQFVDSFPISNKEPFEFLFGGNEIKELRWKNEMGITDESLTAEESIIFLANKFGYPEYMPLIDKRNALAISSVVHLQRFRRHTVITIAYDVSDETVAAIEEESERFSGVFVDTESLRVYPKGRYFAHTVGYIGRLTTDAELERFAPHGYRESDIIGKTGLESRFELELAGEDGDMAVEVNRFSKRVSVVDVNPPTPGHNIYLTMDARLQQKTFEILEDVLTQIIINQLTGANGARASITQQQLLASMVASYNVSMVDIFNAQEGTASYTIKSYVIRVLPTANVNTVQDLQDIRDIVVAGIRNGSISTSQMLLVLHEQGIISGDERFVSDLRNGRLSTLQVIIDKMNSGEITPQMTNLDPSTGSVVVVDVTNGDVLAAVAYPSFDSNQLVNNFNNEYYNRLLRDPTIPMMNRPFMEARAPGSTFKMISGIAALEHNIITPTTRIHDGIVFTRAGSPPVRSWSTRSFGAINVADAIEVSSNYFFSDVTFRMGNAGMGTTIEGIAKLNEFMIAFGLNDRTGVEVGEFRDTIDEDIMIVSSPEYMRFITLGRNPYADYTWRDGDTARTSIGQGLNNYTSASMAKVMATFVNGDRYKLNLVNRIEDSENNLYKKFEPVLETTVEMQPANLQAIHDGMLAVTEGQRGTARSIFRGFEVRVAGKTGTAQQISGRNDHTSFGAFAPYEDPQIAIYVMVPFGDTRATPAASSVIAKRVIAEYMGLNNEVNIKQQANTLSH